jgi:NADH-quinone oxidoreductase subunit A
VIPESYFPVLLFVVVGIVVGGVSLLLGRVLAPHRPDSHKNAAYECGFPAFDTARARFDVRYYLVAMLFILFDIETAFLFPWSASMRDLGWEGLLVLLVFILELAAGLWWIWKRGALDWE